MEFLYKIHILAHVRVCADLILAVLNECYFLFLHIIICLCLEEKGGKHKYLPIIWKHAVNNTENSFKTDNHKVPKESAEVSSSTCRANNWLSCFHNQYLHTKMTHQLDVLRTLYLHEVVFLSSTIS